MAGIETKSRLRDWEKGDTASERLAARILRAEGFSSIDPSHPLGGKDGLKDMVCKRDGKEWIGAAYFPRRQQTFTQIRKKFLGDLQGVKKNQVDGIVFVTNQELSLAERAKLKKLAGDAEIEILHLERLALILDSPLCYGDRLEFLDIEMTKEEQLAMFAQRDELLLDLRADMASLLSHLMKENDKTGAVEILKAFRFLLDEGTGNTANYRSLIKGLYSSLDEAVPVLIKSATFDDFILRSVGSKPIPKQFPQDWKADWRSYSSSTHATAYGMATEEESSMRYAMLRNRHLELDEVALRVFREQHIALKAAIDI